VSGESKWLKMEHVVFYIVERPALSLSRANGGEYKESGDSSIDDYLAPVEVIFKHLHVFTV
jgi:hypothetical protein